MSWSFEFIGQTAPVKAKVISECDKIALAYDGKEEAKDVLAVKDRISSIIDVLDIDTYNNAVSVKANGSQGISSKGVMNASVTFTVIRIHLEL